MSDLIDRQAAIRWVKTECNPYGKPTLDFESGKKVIEHLEQMPSAQSEIIFEDVKKYCEKRHLVILTREFYDEMKRTLQSVQPERMTNRQWVDFLSAQFDISRTSAKEMLHGMMRWKKEDNFKKMFNGGKT